MSQSTNKRNLVEMDRRGFLAAAGAGAAVAAAAAATAVTLSPFARAESKEGNSQQRSDAVEEKTWLAHGLTAAQRESIRAACQWGIDNKFIPGGALLLAQRGEIVFREGFGVTDLKTGRPFAADAPCRIASLTKPHTSTMMAILAEQGKFAWDDPIDKYLPCFKGVKVRGKDAAARQPKIRELLSHTSGFPGKKPLEEGQWKLKTDGGLKEAAEDLPRQGLAAEPGTVFAYTSVGYLVAGRIAEIVTGKEYTALMEETLLRPIGATTATFRPSKELEETMPIYYDRNPSGLVPVDIAARKAAMGSLISPAGSLISTLDDVGRFLMLHRNKGLVDGKRLVAAESLQTLYKPWRATGGPGYGMGFNVMKTGPNGVGVRIRHTGASGTLGQLDFENDFLIVLLTQVPQLRTGPFRERLLKAILSVFAPQEQGAAESPDREGQ